MEPDSIDCLSYSYSDGMDDDDGVPAASARLPRPLLKSASTAGPAAAAPDRAGAGGPGPLVPQATGVHELLECPVCTNSMYPPIHQMARTRLTARKSAGGRAPRHQLLARTLEDVDNPVTYLTHGRSTGDMVQRLKHLLRCAGYTGKLVVYYNTTRVFRAEREEWKSETSIYHDNKLLKRHNSPAWRSTMAEAEKDATWEAITCQSYINRSRLEGTKYMYAPQRQSGTAEFIHEPLQEGYTTSQMDLSLNDGVSLSTRLQDCQQELQYVRDLLKKKEAILRGYMRTRNGEQSELYVSEDDTWTPDSPDRRAAKRSRTSPPAPEPPRAESG